MAPPAPEKTSGAPAFPATGSLPLGSTHDVAALLGVTVSRVYFLMRNRTRGFPEPVARLASGKTRAFPVWWMPAVETWNATARETKPGRPARKPQPT